MAMIPVVGATGGYFSLNCSLMVEIISYEELDTTERIRLKVLKNLNEDSGCKYEEGEEFTYERTKNRIEGELEGLTLD